MKIAMFFTRQKPPRRRARVTHIELPTSWTDRDWADLPAHHPRKD